MVSKHISYSILHYSQVVNIKHSVFFAVRYTLEFNANVTLKLTNGMKKGKRRPFDSVMTWKRTESGQTLMAKVCHRFAFLFRSCGSEV